MKCKFLLEDCRLNYEFPVTLNWQLKDAASISVITLFLSCENLAYIKLSSLSLNILLRKSPFSFRSIHDFNCQLSQPWLTNIVIFPVYISWKRVTEKLQSSKTTIFLNLLIIWAFAEPCMYFIHLSTSTNKCRIILELFFLSKTWLFIRYSLALSTGRS